MGNLHPLSIPPENPLGADSELWTLWRMQQLYGFMLEGRNYALGATDVRTLQLLIDIADARAKLIVPSPAWLLPFRDRIRAATLPEVRALLALAAQATSEPTLKCLAVWLRGRCGGYTGTQAIAELRHDPNPTLRKEVARALQRMHAWAALREMSWYDPSPRIRRMARQTAARPFRQRMRQFMGQVAPHKTSSASGELFVRDEVELQPGRPPKSRWLLRAVLERIRALVRGESPGKMKAGCPLAGD